MKRKIFTKEFKLKALNLCLMGESVKKIAEKLSIREELIRRWRKEYHEVGEGSFSGYGNPNLSKEQKQMVELSKQLKEVKIERDILKKSRQFLFKKKSQIFDFIRKHRHAFPIEKMCKILNVSRSGFYSNTNKIFSKQYIEVENKENNKVYNKPLLRA